MLQKQRGKLKSEWRPFWIVRNSKRAPPLCFTRKLTPACLWRRSGNRRPQKHLGLQKGRYKNYCKSTRISTIMGSALFQAWEKLQKKHLAQCIDAGWVTRYARIEKEEHVSYLTGCSYEAAFKKGATKIIAKVFEFARKSVAPFLKRTKNETPRFWSALCCFCFVCPSNFVAFDE